MMRTLEKAVRTATIEGKNWKQELYTFLRQYRATPHSTTGKSPSELLNGRKLKSTLPQILRDQSSSELRERDTKKKGEMKEYADKHNHAKEANLDVGDKVLLKQPKQNKLSTPFKPEPYEIQEKKGSMVTAQNENHTVTRNASFFKKLPSSTKIAQREEEEEESQCNPNNPEQQSQENESTDDTQAPQHTLRRSARTTMVPTHFKDYVL
jgi:hypothetical protein